MTLRNNHVATRSFPIALIVHFKALCFKLFEFPPVDMGEQRHVLEVDLNDGLGFKYSNSVVKSWFWSCLRVFGKVVFITICVVACCTLFWVEAATVSELTPIYTLEEMKQVEEAEGDLHLKNFVYILWVFATYTFFGEMMAILSLNEKIRILESLRHRTKMESILSLIRQKTYFDTHAVEFILHNQQNLLIETVVDELEAEEMVYQRVHGMNPHKKFEFFRD